MMMMMMMNEITFLPLTRFYTYWLQQCVFQRWHSKFIHQGISIFEYCTFLASALNVIDQIWRHYPEGEWLMDFFCRQSPETHAKNKNHFVMQGPCIMYNVGSSLRKPRTWVVWSQWQHENWHWTICRSFCCSSTVTSVWVWWHITVHTRVVTWNTWSSCGCGEIIPVGRKRDTRTSTSTPLAYFSRTEMGVPW